MGCRQGALLFLAICLTPLTSGAWGARGHEVVTSVAARLLAESDPKFSFLKNHEFDLGYYANVPDVIWRTMSEHSSHVEPPQHYIDWNKTLATAFGEPKNLPLEFADYKKKLGDGFRIGLGVSPYRIHGIISRCKSLASHLTRETQGPLLVCLGLLSHYTGDLAMPLHVSENHDGQLSHQEGVHAFFETQLVNELDPQLKVDVLSLARADFKKSELLKLQSDVLTRWMIADSFAHVEELLRLDKEQNRKDIAVAREKFKPLIESRLVLGAIFTAVVWKEILDPITSFDDKHFIYFEGLPRYLEPGKEKETK